MAVTTTENNMVEAQPQGECQPNGGMHMLMDFFDKESQRIMHKCARCKTLFKKPTTKK